MPRVAETLPFVPRGLNREQAAAYVGIGSTMFDELVGEGVMPEPAAKSPAVDGHATC